MFFVPIPVVFSLLGLLLSATGRCVLPPKPHGDESIGREIRLQKFSGCARGAKQSFGGEIATAHGAFHRRDRKSTRLNSSHGYISYAVFCLKKKKDQKRQRV